MTVARTQISDEELRVLTMLKTAGALTQVGNFYKEFGLDEKAGLKYGEALEVCEEAAEQARKLGSTTLEEGYQQLWRIYFAMEKLDQALVICERLQREFPQSAFIDEAIFQQAQVARKQFDHLVAEFPESALAEEARKISEALIKGGF